MGSEPQFLTGKTSSSVTYMPVEGRTDSGGRQIYQDPLGNYVTNRSVSELPTAYVPVGSNAPSITTGGGGGSAPSSAPQAPSAPVVEAPKPPSQFVYAKDVEGRAGAGKGALIMTSRSEAIIGGMQVVRPNSGEVVEDYRDVGAPVREGIAGLPSGARNIQASANGAEIFLQYEIEETAKPAAPSYYVNPQTGLPLRSPIDKILSPRDTGYTGLNQSQSDNQSSMSQPYSNIEDDKNISFGGGASRGAGAGVGPAGKAATEYPLDFDMKKPVSDPSFWLRSEPVKTGDFGAFGRNVVRQSKNLIVGLGYGITMILPSTILLGKELLFGGKPVETIKETVGGTIKSFKREPVATFGQFTGGAIVLGAATPKVSGLAGKIRPTEVPVAYVGDAKVPIGKPQARWFWEKPAKTVDMTQTAKVAMSEPPIVREMRGSIRIPTRTTRPDVSVSRADTNIFWMQSKKAGLLESDIRVAVRRRVSPSAVRVEKQNVELSALVKDITKSGDENVKISGRSYDRRKYFAAGNARVTSGKEARNIGLLAKIEALKVSEKFSLSKGRTVVLDNAKKPVLLSDSMSKSFLQAEREGPIGIHTRAGRIVEAESESMVSSRAISSDKGLIRNRFKEKVVEKLGIAEEVKKKVKVNGAKPKMFNEPRVWNEGIRYGYGKATLGKAADATRIFKLVEKKDTAGYGGGGRGVILKSKNDILSSSVSKPFIEAVKKNIVLEESKGSVVVNPPSSFGKVEVMTIKKIPVSSWEKTAAKPTARGGGGLILSGASASLIQKAPLAQAHFSRVGTIKEKSYKKTRSIEDSAFLDRQEEMPITRPRVRTIISQDYAPRVESIPFSSQKSFEGFAQREKQLQRNLERLQFRQRTAQRTIGFPRIGRTPSDRPRVIPIPRIFPKGENPFRAEKKRRPQFSGYREKSWPLADSKRMMKKLLG